MTTEPPPLPEDTSNLAGNFGPSPSQTVGPYFHQGLVPGVQGLQAGLGHVMVTPGSPVPGERVTLTGRVLDGDGVTIEDALIEVWQADANGAYPARADADFGGYGRAHTRTPLHRYALYTLKPGSAAPGLAPRLNVWLGMRGLLTHLVTAVYFSDEDNSGDPLLNAVPDHRRHTLIARREDTPDGAVYHLDFRMQGQDETVFFDAY